MPVFTAGNNAVSVAPLELITAAYLETGATAAGEVLSAADAAWGLEKLQRLIDRFNAMREMIFSHGFAQYNLQANHAPHTIGPTGNFQVPIRPVRIVSASFILNGASANPVDTPIAIRDDDWWAANPLKSMVSSVVSDLYYGAEQPNGNLNFWPIANAVAPVRLETWTSLAQAIDLPTPLGFVQGYWDAIVLSLAVGLCPSLGTQPSPALLASQAAAMKAILANNAGSPRIETTDGGMPNSGRGGRPDFNFLTGLRE